MSASRPGSNPSPVRGAVEHCGANVGEVELLRFAVTIEDSHSRQFLAEFAAQVLPMLGLMTRPFKIELEGLSGVENGEIVPLSSASAALLRRVALNRANRTGRSTPT